MIHLADRRAPIRRFGAVIVTAMLSACASLSPIASPQDEVAVPSAWSTSLAAANGAPADISAARSGTDLMQWWARFDDPMLGALVAQAMQANTSVKSAQAALLQARALRDVAAAGLWPSVNGTASAQRSKSGAGSASNGFSAGFDASWEPDVFGGNHSALQASEADARASAASLADIQVSIAAEVALDYIQMRGAQARMAIATNNLASQRETLQITDWRTQAGLATALDAEQARTSVEQVSAQIPVLATTIAQAQHALSVLSGQAPAALQARLADPRPVPQAASDLVLNIPAETLRQRPDVRAAEHRVSAALARVAQADAARYPSFGISGSLGLQAASLGALTGPGAVVSALLGSVSVPLFDAGAARARVSAQAAALEQARVAYQATVLGALKDVEDALIALRNDRERLVHLTSAAEAAANAALMAQQRYTGGLVDFQVVLETQRSLLSTQDGVASTTADLGADHVRLYKALGGGWRPSDEAAPATPNLSEISSEMPKAANS